MSIYTFSSEYLYHVINHALGCDMTTDSLSLSGSTYTFTTDAPFPQDQYDHLRTFTDLTQVL